MRDATNIDELSSYFDRKQPNILGMCCKPSMGWTTDINLHFLWVCGCMENKTCQKTIIQKLNLDIKQGENLTTPYSNTINVKL
jgi:hypothetical protein